MIVEENGSDLKARLTHENAQGIAAEAIEVDSALSGLGMELAVHDAPRGSRLSIHLESAQDFDVPPPVRLKLFRYDAEAAANPAVRARIEALRAWYAATDVQRAGAGRQVALSDIDVALAHFESAGGDPALAAWARMVRFRLNYRDLDDLKTALRDVQSAARGFAAIGAARDEARARLMEVSTLLEIAGDSTARDPTAEEAARNARRILLPLNIDASLSALERARVVNYLGVLDYNVYDWPGARKHWLEAIPKYEAIGARDGRIQALQNLGVLAAEEGDYRESLRYFDRVIDELDHVGSIAQKISLLSNAAGAAINSGRVDRAIELLLWALELTHEEELPKNEARVLHGLGRAYAARGDVAQAATLFDEALKLRRTIEDPIGLNSSLRASGVLARDAGDFEKALALHGEADSMAATADMRIYTLLELARDHAAASDFQRAIAACRKALAVGADTPEFYKLHEVRLVLADALLAQPVRTPQAIAEATTISQTALKAALLRDDTSIELASRRLLAQAHLARGALREAREEYQRAIALIFRYRSNISNPELQAATMALERQTFGGYVDLLMSGVAKRGPNKLRVVTADEEEALRTLEWARAIYFDSTRASQLDAAAQASIDELLAAMAGKRVRVASLLDRTADSTRELEILQLDIAKLRAQVDQQRAASARGSMRSASPLVDASWPEFEKGTTQLSYMLDTRSAYLWVRDSTGIRATLLAASPASVARDAASFVVAIKSGLPQKIDEALTRLSGALLPPGVLADDSTTIQVVADGHISGIPFAALRASKALSVETITSLFEAGATNLPNPRRPLDLVALASDARSIAEGPEAKVFSILQTTNAEVRSVAAIFRSRDPNSTLKLLLGVDGTAGNLMKLWQGGVDVIHFATHGLADLRQPLTSLILLPAPDAAGKASYLTAGQVQEWRGDVNLVFLGACDTAVGPARFAEGMSGMQGAFLRAGARGVIATLWPVEDVYASQFAADFYRRYVTGTLAAQALSETQSAWMKPTPGIRDGEQMHRRMTAWAHAYYAQ